MFSESILRVNERLRELGLAQTAHSGSDFISHLNGVWRILQRWQQTETIQLAGLCHSLYGTDVFRSSPLPLREREQIRELIGFDAEALVYEFCSIRRASLLSAQPTHEGVWVYDRFAQGQKLITVRVWCDLLVISLANDLEQKPRLPLAKQLAIKSTYFILQGRLPLLAWLEFQEVYRVPRNLNKQILVTGMSSAFLGPVVVQALLSYGFSVSVVLASRFQIRMPPEVQVLEINSEADVERLLRHSNWFAVIDLVTETLSELSRALQIFQGKIHTYVLAAAHLRIPNLESIDTEVFKPRGQRNLILQWPGFLVDSSSSSPLYKAIWRILSGVSVPADFQVSFLPALLPTSEAGLFLAHSLSIESIGVVKLVGYEQIKFSEFSQLVQNYIQNPSVATLPNASTSVRWENAQIPLEINGFAFRNPHEWLATSVEQICWQLQGSVVKNVDGSG